MNPVYRRVKTNYSGRLHRLVELLIVISIIGVLVALAMPAVNSSCESGWWGTVQQYYLHQLALGCLALTKLSTPFLPAGGWVILLGRLP